MLRTVRTVNEVDQRGRHEMRQMADRGDRLVVLGDEGTGIAIMKADSFLKIADNIGR